MNDQGNILDNGGSIPIKRSEANVQAEFYHQARLIGLNCVLEFITPKGRLDIVILNKQETHMYAIVECKNGYEMNPCGRQIIRYQKLGLPIFTLKFSKDARALVLRVLSLVDSTPGIPIQQIMDMPREQRNGLARRPKRKAFLWLDEDLNVREVI